MDKSIIESYPRYESYKDSGVDWLGDIPEDWTTEKGKWLFKKMERPVRDEDGIVTCFRDGEVTLRSNRRVDGFTNALKEHGYQGIRKGDLVIHQMDAFAGAIGVSDSDGKSTPVYSVCTPQDTSKVIPTYYSYFLRSMAQRGFILSLAKGIRERSTDFRYNDFSKLDLPLPPYDVQAKLVSFISKKTNQIDQAIDLKQNQIKKLEEYKQIVIQNAVTKGLNPDVPMKDSGIDWIGDIPGHWEVKKLKYIADVVLGKMICNENKGGMFLKPYLKSKNIQWLNVDISSVDEMWFTEKEMSIYRLKKDDLILSEGGEVGKTCIWNDELAECYIQNSAHKVSFNETYNPWYFLYQFFTLGKQGQFDRIVNRVSIGHLTKDKLINTSLIVPPLDEQSLIVKYIESIEKLILSNIELYEQQIESLKEYKTVLINEAVTGKIKVA